MIRMNGRFVELLRSCRDAIKKEPLEAELARIADAGIVSTDQGFVLREFADVETNATRENFPDATGYECFINHLHIEDYIGKPSATQSILLAICVLAKWIDQGHAGQLIAIISSDEESVIVRFHHKRPNESWLAADLNGYEGAVLEISSADLLFFDLLA
jgi:hypothetical protein